jgi:hypothetical protein
VKTSAVTRSWSLHRAARDELWLDDARHGLSPERIADRDGVPAARVRQGIDRAMALEGRRGTRRHDADD